MAKLLDTARKNAKIFLAMFSVCPVQTLTRRIFDIMAVASKPEKIAELSIAMGQEKRAAGMFFQLPKPARGSPPQLYVERTPRDISQPIHFGGKILYCGFGSGVPLRIQIQVFNE